MYTEYSVGKCSFLKAMDVPTLSEDRYINHKVSRQVL